MLLSAVVTAYFGALPLGIVLDEEQVTRNLKKAVRYYCGFATLANSPSAADVALAALPVDPLTAPRGEYRLGDTAAAYWLRANAVAGKDVHTTISADNTVTDDQDFDLTPSEHSIIEPLFRLYCEWENAQAIQVSRANGHEAWGREPSEIQSDITLAEENVEGKAWFEEVYTI
ncbi:hypothetical protein [Pseudomonas sp.]|jgi:hypothetical protein|uniref:hypothetical protein n=1 Tax=Pseudomonas sp. TaxID=306 RepID=UPI002ED8F672